MPHHSLLQPLPAVCQLFVASMELLQQSHPPTTMRRKRKSSVCLSLIPTTSPLRKRRSCRNNKDFSQPKVRFSGQNQYWESQTTPDDLESLWYTKDDLRAMEAAANVDARRLKAHEKHTTDPNASWSRSLFRIFRALQRTTTAQDVEQLLQQCAVRGSPIQLPAAAMGLEGVIVSPISRDFVARRRHILAQLQWRQQQQQQSSFLDGQEYCVETMAEAVRRESRVARLYAQVLAQASLNANDDGD